jgi:hypothetical protein
VPNETAGGLTNAGRVYVFYGGPVFSSGTSLNVDQDADVVLTGGCLKDKAGGPLAIGELSGDAYLDLVIGQPRSQRCIPSSTDLGRVQVVFGGTSLPASLDLFDDADATLNLSGDGSPGSVGRVGFKTGQTVLVEDVDGDDQGDLWIGSPGAFHAQGTNGWVHVAFGGSGFGGSYELDTDADLWVETPEPVGPRLVAGRMGEALAGGDFNNDGKPDMAMGAPKGLAEDGGFVPLLYDPIGGGGACPSEVTVAGEPDRIAWIELLDGVRDEVLSRMPNGDWLISAYYRHADEVAWQLLTDRRLRNQALLLLRQVRPELELAVAGKALKLGRMDRREIRGFARALGERASQELKRDLEEFLSTF